MSRNTEERLTESPIRRRCGTTSGYNAHQESGVKPCDACAAAKREYDKRWRGAGDQTIRSRLSARAQGRARTRLVNMTKDVYDRLYQEELERAYMEAGVDL